MSPRVLCRLSIFALAALGCSFAPDSKVLTGKYSLNRAPYKDSLFINQDNTYKHKFTKTSGQIFEADGKWKYDSLNAEILFKDFVFFSDAGADDLPPGNWYAKVEVTNAGEVRLIYSSEDRIYFSKRQ